MLECVCIYGVHKQSMDIGSTSPLKFLLLYDLTALRKSLNFLFYINLIFVCKMREPIQMILTFLFCLSVVYSASLCKFFKILIILFIVYRYINLFRGILICLVVIEIIKNGRFVITNIDARHPGMWSQVCLRKHHYE